MYVQFQIYPGNKGLISLHFSSCLGLLHALPFLPQHCTRAHAACDSARLAHRAQVYDYGRTLNLNSHMAGCESQWGDLLLWHIILQQQQQPTGWDTEGLNTADRLMPSCGERKQNARVHTHTHTRTGTRKQYEEQAQSGRVVLFFIFSNKGQAVTLKFIDLLLFSRSVSVAANHCVCTGVCTCVFNQI